jgi:osmotically-inducible protein OsmY
MPSIVCYWEWNDMRRLVLAVLLAVPFVNGCAPLVVGGAAATGVVVAEDRRTVGTITEDQAIELKASNRIGDRVKNAHVNVTSYNRMVLLTGEVADAAAKATAEKTAQGVENVRSVFNELAIGPNSALSARANDTYLTSVVKARFVDAQRFSPVHVKVVTEAGVVYLLGMVTRKEADAATQIARTTRGVQRVVRVFEYLD